MTDLICFSMSQVVPPWPTATATKLTCPGWARPLCCCWMSPYHSHSPTNPNHPHKPSCLPAEALEAGKQIAREHGCIVAISGAEDLVSNETR